MIYVYSFGVISSFYFWWVDGHKKTDFLIKVCFFMFKIDFVIKL